MPESNMRSVARLIVALTETERIISNEALPEDAAIAARTFLDNHNAVIEPAKK